MVADEVRNLAVKSADTVKEAEMHTREIFSNIGEIKDSSNTIMSEVISTQSSVENTDRAVDELNESSQSIDGSVTEVSAVIEELNAIASRLISEN